jgi:hypothetical protein
MNGEKFLFLSLLLTATTSMLTAKTMRGENYLDSKIDESKVRRVSEGCLLKRMNAHQLVPIMQLNESR